jgi:hypothetical protein
MENLGDHVNLYHDVTDLQFLSVKLSKLSPNPVQVNVGFAAHFARRLDHVDGSRRFHEPGENLVGGYFSLAVVGINGDWNRQRNGSVHIDTIDVKSHSKGKCIRAAAIANSDRHLALGVFFEDGIDSFTRKGEFKVVAEGRNVAVLTKLRVICREAAAQTPTYCSILQTPSTGSSATFGSIESRYLLSHVFQHRCPK